MPNYLPEEKEFKQGEVFSAELVDVKHTTKQVTVSDLVMRPDGSIAHPGVEAETITQHIYRLCFKVIADEIYDPIYTYLFLKDGVALNDGSTKSLAVNDINLKKINYMLAQNGHIERDEKGRLVLPDIPEKREEIGAFLNKYVSKVTFEVTGISKTVADKKDPVTGKPVHREYTKVDLDPVKPDVKAILAAKATEDKKLKKGE